MGTGARYSSVLHYTIICPILYSTALHSTLHFVLYCAVLYSTLHLVLYCTALHSTLHPVLYCTARHTTVWLLRAESRVTLHLLGIRMLVCKEGLVTRLALFVCYFSCQVKTLCFWKRLVYHVKIFCYEIK